LKKLIFFLLAVTTLALANVTVSAQEMKILSDNQLTATDYNLYADKGISLSAIQTGATYSWTEDSDEQMVATSENEGHGAEMTGGGILNYSGTNTACSKWDAANPSTMIFDLKDIYTLSQVDLWSVSTSGAQLGQVFLSISDDGNTYTDLGVWQGVVPDESEKNGSGQANSYTPCSFPEKNARFVKITINRKATTFSGINSHQYPLSEVLILGREQVTPAVNAEITYVNDADSFVYGYTPDNTVYAKAEVSDIDAILLSACYEDGGRLKQVLSKKGSYLRYGEKYEIKQPITFADWKETDTIRSYVFTATDKIKPVSCPAELGYFADISQTGLLSSNHSRTASNLVYPVSDGYSWVQGGAEATAASFVGQEVLLFDGNTSTVASVNSSEEAYANLKIHFKDTMQVQSVSVYAEAVGLAGYDIYASMDGISYEFVTSVENTSTASRYRALSQNISGVLYAKDIKVVVKKRDGQNNLNIAEVEVFGRPPQFEKVAETNYSYEQVVPFETAEDIVLADAEGSALSDGDTQTAVQSAGDYVSIIYSFDEYLQVEDIKIWGQHDGCEVLLSPDGLNYTTSGFYPGRNGMTNAYGRSETNAKYAKLVFRKGALEKISLQEIKLMTRKLYDVNAEVNTTPEKVPVRVEVKPNNVLFIDWSDYNAPKNRAKKYKVYIEPANFTSTTGKTLKEVYENGVSSRVGLVESQFCLYTGLEPDEEYYVAVIPADFGELPVTPTKIQTYSALGGEKLSGIFCTNEYPYGGGAHIKHEGEYTESQNLKVKLKLIQDMEVFSKTRYWTNQTDIFDTYFSRGFGFHQYAREVDIETVNSYGIYAFVHANEPEIASKTVEISGTPVTIEKYYLKHPEEYLPLIKETYAITKAANEKNLLAETSICGTDNLSFMEDLYELEPKLGNYYDVFDVHAYCKKFEGQNGYDDDFRNTTESYSVPEHIFGKVDNIRTLLGKYGDADKPIIFTEVGWSTHDTTKNEIVVEKVTREQQANYVARCYLVSALCGVDNVFLYAFQDEGPELGNVEWQFGIVDWYGKPKPAYFTNYTLGKLLKDATVVKRIETLEHTNYGGVFYDEAKDMYLTALWNNSGNGDTVSFTTKDKTVLIVDAYGNLSEKTNVETLTIGSAPIYVYTTDIPTVVAE